jgi:hypothetical protein
MFLGGRWEIGDGRLEIGDGRLEMGDGRLEMGDWRWEIGDWRLEMGDGNSTEPTQSELVQFYSQLDLLQKRLLLCHVSSHLERE